MPTGRKKTNGQESSPAAPSPQSARALEDVTVPGIASPRIPRAAATPAATLPPAAGGQVLPGAAAVASAPTVAATPAAASAAMAARRVVRSQDFLSKGANMDRAAVLKSRAHAVTRFRLELEETKGQLKLLKGALARTIPTTLTGRAMQPDGSAGALLQVEFQVPGMLLSLGHRVVNTDKEGDFAVAVPGGVTFPATISFTFRGADASAVVVVESKNVGINGLMGDVRLPAPLKPLPISILASLEGITSAWSTVSKPAQSQPPALVPRLSFGEEGECLLTYRADVSQDRFPYSVFVRLVEPRTSIVSPVIRVTGPNQRYFPVTDYFPLSEEGDVSVDYVDRVPVDQPISVDGFRDQLVGVGENDRISAYETVAMAGTLGLGYIICMAQSWQPRGLTLGNLVYSLPLAPGEQQRIAVFERQETTMVRETEMMVEEEEQRFAQETDASARAVFNSSFDESARGGSSFLSASASGGGGGTFLVFSWGGGGSASSGSSSSWMSGHRGYTSRAEEDLHTSLQRQAEARRHAFRTGMRLATNSESAEVMTKVITNHNHLHALTLQYWEVQRLYEVSSRVEGVTLVCLVPLQVIRFLPPEQPLTLADTTSVDSRSEILGRYAQITKHADILERWLPRQYRYGLALLRQFVADPVAKVETAGSAAQDIIEISVMGTFLPFEEIYVRAVTRRGSRIGAIRLTGTVMPIPDADDDQAAAYITDDALVAGLRERRNNVDAGARFAARIALPPSTAREDIVGFEITRRFQRFSYHLANADLQTVKLLNLTITVPPANPISPTIHLAPQKLEQELGGPLVWDFSAVIKSAANPPTDVVYAAGYLPAPERLPATPFPIPAFRQAPVLRYSQVLEIEGVLQHVVRNTVYYSKAVWQSLTPEERVIMLEGYTIGVPAEGITDESQNVPLLNCVENRVLGFYGNSMIMPFNIPPDVAEKVQMTNADIQDALAQFHGEAFTPITSMIALPTRGVLAEAVLGHCPSGEKIDITRFWNWQDSPSDAATNIADVTLPTDKSVTTGLQGPSALTGLPAMINNINANPNVPGSDAALLQAMVQSAAQQKGFDVSALTNAEALSKLILGNQQTADKARADALETTRQLQAQSMATAGNILGGIYAKNPEAGSQAAAAVYGTGSKDKASAGTESGNTPKKEQTTSGGTAPATGATTSGSATPGTATSGSTPGGSGTTSAGSPSKGAGG